FHLGRLDVWSIDDLGVRKGYSSIFGLEELIKAKVLEPLGERFRPYRSILAWYCWAAVDQGNELWD
ncbi:DNA-3-methyladenine glycosylase II, partial [mine drainage metagenome]